MSKASFALAALLYLVATFAQATPIIQERQIQVLHHYVAGGFPGADGEFDDIDVACQSFVGYRQDNGGGYRYEYWGYKPTTPGFYVCSYMLRAVDANAENQRVDSGPYEYGGVAAMYRLSCQGPMTPIVNSWCGLVPEEDIGKSDCNTCHPINVSNGNKYLSEVLYRGAGPFPLVFALRYNSKDAKPYVPNAQLFIAPAPLVTQGFNRFDPVAPLSIAQVNTLESSSMAVGTGWIHNYQRSIRVYEGNNALTMAREDGKLMLYRKVASTSTYVAENDRHASVQETTDGGGARMFVYTGENDEREFYNANGRLIRILNRDNLEHTLHYDIDGKLTEVVDSFGHKLTFIYNAYTLLEVIDPAGGHFAINSDGRRLNSITMPDTHVKTFLYENPDFPNHVTGIIDENGARHASYVYDATGRGALEYLGADVNRFQIDYTDGTKTIVTDPLNTARTTTYQEIFGVKRIASTSQPAGAGSAPAADATTYDAAGNVESRKDFNGTTTFFSYNARNLVIKAVEAKGSALARTITTDWHPSFKVPVQIAEPKRITKYDIDATGHVSFLTVQATSDDTGEQGFSAVRVGLPRTTTFTYATNGQVSTITGPRPNAQQIFTYDSAGNIATVQNAAGHLSSLSDYDAHGRVGRIVDANGITTVLSYTPRGWLASHSVQGKSGAALLTTFDHDGVGQVRSTTMPDQTVIYYTYDDAHRLKKIADASGNEISYTLDNIGNRTVEKVTDPSGTLVKQTTRVIDALNRVKQITGGAQ